MHRLTLQIHHNVRGWLDAATLELAENGPARLAYDVDYAFEFVGRTDAFALSIRFPVDLSVYQGALPAFVLDLIPQGEPLRRILARYKLTREQDYGAILAKVPLAPPGNIRVKEPWTTIEAERPGYQHSGFNRDDIGARSMDFVDYMETKGAPVGGTSGAGGGSPKFMLREDRHRRLHAEGWLDDHATSRALLVKLPYTDSLNSRMLAKVEKSYYDLLRTLPLVTGPALEIDEDTLFITRFDRQAEADGTLLYHGLESLYSAHGVIQHGAYLSHEDNIQLLASHSTAPAEDVTEYLRRDLVNQMLANTDNHGRNTSLLKKDGSIRLSPLYDVTAMRFFSGDFITELTRWRTVDLAARLAWTATATGISMAELTASLKDLARATRGLEDRMQKVGVDPDVIDRSRQERDRVQSALDSLA